MCLPARAPLLGHLARLRGPAEYPTIDDFAYTEELTFSQVGKPFLVMTQRSGDASTGEPLHSEAGFLRALPGGAVELAIAQPLGVVEIDVGSALPCSGGVMVDLRSAHVGLTPTAKSVTAVRRRLTVTGSTLVSELWMAAVGETGLLRHLRSELQQS